MKKNWIGSWFNVKQGIAGCSLLILPLLAYAKSLPNISEVVHQASPAVVNISTYSKNTTKKLIPDHLRDDIENTPLMDFLKEMFGNQLEENLSGKGPGLGTGSIIGSDGLIVTNYHVIKGAETIKIRLKDRREFLAKVLGVDTGTDLALLKIDAKNLPTIKIKSLEVPKVGQWVVAIGSPFGFENSVTVGIVSATGRSLGDERYVPFIQTDVAINPGNSGGPLLNLNGELVGINSQIVSESGNFVGLSFSVPTEIVLSVVKQIQEKGRVSRGWLGVAFQDLDKNLATSFGLDRSKGALVTKVIPGSPAFDAGLQAGDVIISLNNQDIVHASDLAPVVGLIAISETVPVKVFRKGKHRTMKLTLGNVPRVKWEVGKSLSSKKAMFIKYGIKVRDLDVQEIKHLQIMSKGLIVEKILDPIWHQAGIHSGDVILRVNRKPVENPNQFYSVLNTIPNNTHVPVLILREGGYQRYTSIKFEK